MSANPDAVNPSQGEFRSRVPPAAPMTTKGHAVGVKVGNDAVPEFHTEQHPPGTAPPQDSYQPNAQSSVPGQADNPTMDEGARTSALDSIPGATSASIYNDAEFGRPGQGQTSGEIISGKGKKERHGLEGVGASASDAGVPGQARARGLDLEGRAAEMKGQKGKSGSTEGGLNWTGAEEMEPVSSEQLASERD